MEENFLFFWKTVKPTLYQKFNAREKINLNENGEIVKTKKGTVEAFNNFFRNVVKNK